MTFSRYNKPALSLEEQADLLLSRGLQGITKNDLVAQLAKTNYYRLRGYTYPYQDNSSDQELFRPGTVWQQIWNDYTLDIALRSLLFEAISHIEVAIRTQLILQCSLTNGPCWYKDKSLFKNESRFNEDVRDLLKYWARAREVFKSHYELKYGNASDPPAWMIFETTTFGNVSKFFSNLNDSSPAKAKISGFFGFTKSSSSMLESWLHHLNLVRNICAHHSRLFSRSLIVKAKWPTTKPTKWVSEWPAQNKVFASICIIASLIEICIKTNDFRARLKELLHQADEMQLTMMGFPANWEQEELFK